MKTICFSFSCFLIIILLKYLVLLLHYSYFPKAVFGFSLCISDSIELFAGENALRLS